MLIIVLKKLILIKTHALMFTMLIKVSSVIKPGSDQWVDPLTRWTDT